MDPHYMTPSMFPPMDSIQEFKIQTNSYSAEFGHYSVQVNASTRSGANDVHGSLYDYLRNDPFDAANFFDNFAGLRKAPLRYNLFGGTFGGPLSVPRVYSGRNRTFFFVTYEGTRIRTSRTSQLSVPTPEQRGGDFSSLGSRNNQPIFDPGATRPNPTGAGAIRDPFAGNLVPASRVTPIAKQVLDFYPLPTSSAARGNNFFSTLGNTSDNNQFVARIDQVLGSKTTLSFRYYFFDGLSTNRSAIRNDGETNDVRTQNMALNVTRNFSARTLYELRFGYNRPRYGILQVGSGGVNYADFRPEEPADGSYCLGYPEREREQFQQHGSGGGSQRPAHERLPAPQSQREPYCRRRPPSAPLFPPWLYSCWSLDAGPPCASNYADRFRHSSEVYTVPGCVVVSGRGS